MKVDGLVCYCEYELSAWSFSPSVVLEVLAGQINRSRRQPYLQHIKRKIRRNSVHHLKQGHLQESIYCSMLL